MGLVSGDTPSQQSQTVLENENRHLTQRHTIGVLAITMSVVKRSGGSETLFSALVMRCVSEKSTRISEKSSVFSVLTSAYFRGPVNLKHTVYPSTSTLNISQNCTMFG